MTVGYRAVMQSRTIDAERRNGLTEPPLFLLAGEHAEEFEALAQECRERLRPDGPVEGFLVECMIHHDWGRRRFARVELELLKRRILERSDEKKLDFVEHVLRSLERAWMSAFKELRRLQKRRGLTAEVR